MAWPMIAAPIAPSHSNRGDAGRRRSHWGSAEAPGWRVHALGVSSQRARESTSRRPRGGSVIPTRDSRSGFTPRRPPKPTGPLQSDSGNGSCPAANVIRAEVWIADYPSNQPRRQDPSHQEMKGSSDLTKINILRSIPVVDQERTNLVAAAEEVFDGLAAESWYRGRI